MKKKILKYILGIIGLIILGAIGSGLWDIGIRPIGNWLMEAIFKVTTLGLSSLSDDFYQEVAKGQREEPSVFALHIVSMLLILNFSFMCGFMLLIRKKTKEHRYEEIKAHVKRSIRWQCRISLISIIILSAFLMFQAFGIMYRNHLVTNFHHKFRIAKVALNEREEEIMLAKFAMIKNKQDYLSILDTLQQKIDNEIQLQENVDIKSSQ